MEGLILENILMIKNTDLEYFNGRTEENTKDNGLTVINMVKELI